MRIYQALCAVVLAAGLCAGQQGQTSNPTPQPAQVAADAANVPGVYGTIKDVKAKEKIVIDVEKGKDRTFNLADPKMVFTMAEDLAVGDKVKIVESGKKGSKSVQIVRDTRSDSGVQRSRTGGDQK